MPLRCWVLVFGADDLAAEVLCGDPVVWWTDVGGGVEFAGAWVASVAAAISFLCGYFGVPCWGSGDSLFIAIFEAGVDMSKSEHSNNFPTNLRSTIVAIDHQITVLIYPH